MRSIMISEEDLAAMRAADAEIEAEFRLTTEDIALSRNMDRAAAMEKLDNRERRIAEYQRAAIVDFRRSTGMNQMDFAKAVGVSNALVSHWECGRSPVNLDKVGAVFPELAEALRKGGAEP